MFDNAMSALARCNNDGVAKFSRFLGWPFYSDTPEVRLGIFAIRRGDNKFLGPIAIGEDSRWVPDEGYRLLTVICNSELELEVC